MNKKKGWASWYADWGYSPDDWGYTNWNEKIDAKESTTAWKDYTTTGYWRGYDSYKTATLDYRYVEQMASALSASHDVTVKVANEWSLDIDNKVLRYNPQALMYGTKAELLASLLHEIGHLRYTTSPTKLEKLSPLSKKYPEATHEVLNVFEDFRIDKLMSKSYGSSEDIFSANETTVREQMKKLSAERLRRDADIRYIARAITHELDDKKRAEMNERLKKLTEVQLEDYLRALYARAYGIKIIESPDVQVYADKTIDALKRAESAKDTTAVLRLLENDVFPVIEPLLESYQTPEQMAGLSELAKSLADDMKKAKKDTIQTRGSSDKPCEIPREWIEGDYKPLYDSVASSVAELVRLLQFIKAKDDTGAWQTRTRSGRLNPKGLFRFASGSQRLFKQMTMPTDRIAELAFSIVLDTSGSMYGSGHEKITHATRAVIMLAEVFERMNIPYEIINFDDRAKTVKGFERTLKERQKELAGLPMYAGGGTLLMAGLEAMKLPKQTQKNKVAIIVSDGGVGNTTPYVARVKNMIESGLKFIGVSLGCTPVEDSQLKAICNGNAVAVANAVELPSVFSKLLKSIL